MLFVLSPDVRVAHEPAARIGAVAYNTASQAPNLAYSPAAGDTFYRNMVPQPPPPNDDELVKAAEQVVGGVRTLVGGGGSSGFLGGLFAPRMPPPPRLILTADLARWPALSPAFPVFVNTPGFGAGLATRFITLETREGIAAGLYYAVKKYAPLGINSQAEPYVLGVYAVPAWMVQRLPLAVSQLFPAENQVVIDNYRGEQFTESFVDFRTTNDPRYVIARRILTLQYPFALTDMFAMRLCLTTPPDMRPGGTVPLRLTQMPPVLDAARNEPQIQ
jgi:hypothetical protein